MENTAINWAELLAPWMQLLIPVVVGFFMALLTWATVELRRRTGIVVEQAHMATLQTALENAAGKAIMMLGDKMKNAQLDAKHPAIKSAVLYANAAALDAIKSFGLTSDQVAEKIIAKVGVLTAPDPTASPKDVTPPPPEPGAGG